MGFYYDLNKTYADIGVLYYNDISADDGITNLGHASHKTGKDIDMRYPGCTNGDGEQLWTVAREYWGNEEKLVTIMNKIYDLAKEWDFTNNYQWKTLAGRASYSSNHNNHFHLGHNK